MALTSDLQAALQLHQGGHLDEAEAAYHAILGAQPGDGHALHFLGVIALQRDDAEAAAVLLQQAVEALPDEPVFLCNLGQALARLGRSDEAMATYKRSLELAPRLVQAWQNLSALHESRNDDLAAFACRLRARDLRTGTKADSDLHRLALRVGRRWFDEGSFAKAADCYREAVAAAPDDSEAWSGLASSQTLCGRPLQAMDAFERALALAPADPYLYNNRANAYRDAGILPQAFADYREALRLRPDYREAISNYLFASLSDTTLDAASLGRRARDHAHAFAAAPVIIASRGGCSRPRIAILSADLRQHPVAWFMLAWFLNRDRSLFHLVIYNVGTQVDAVTGTIRAAADDWIDAAGLDDSALAERISKDSIDLLIDLSGHTADNRLGVFARRPARKAATFLGYAGTTGLDCFDARIADALTEPEDESACSSEAVVRMSGSYFCYSPPDVEVTVAQVPCMKQRHVTFGCSAQLAKVTDATLELWAAVLKAVPKSLLQLRSMALDDQLVRKRLLARAARAGIDTGRIRTQGPRSLAEHLRAWHGVDITLDTTPFNLATQSCESLWMGVPFVTLVGDRHAGRMGASILTGAGLGDLIAYDVHGYIDRCVALAADRSRLQHLRAGMRERLRASGGLMDPHYFASRLDAVLRSIVTVS